MKKEMKKKRLPHFILFTWKRRRVEGEEEEREGRKKKKGGRRRRRGKKRRKAVQSEKRRCRRQRLNRAECNGRSIEYWSGICTAETNNAVRQIADANKKWHKPN